MAASVFQAVLSMSVKASIVVLAVLLLRLVLRKAPKIFSHLLWMVVLFRLLCPVSFQSKIGLFPQLSALSLPVQTLEEEVELPVPAIPADKMTVDAEVSITVLPPAETVATETPPSFWEIASPYLPYLWAAGALFLLLKNFYSLLKLKRSLAVSLPVEENIFLADYIDSPFVLGLIRPKIYLPSTLAEAEWEFVLLHERRHIRRGDHLVKLLFFLALCLHWFNPLVWLSFSLFTKDMEMSCDEGVMREMKGDIRTAYSQAILRFACRSSSPAAAPLAFGEGDAKSRIQNVLSYKKPALWLIAAAVVLLVAAAVMLLTDPKEKASASPFDQSYEVTHHEDLALSLSSYLFTTETAPYFHIYPDGQLFSRAYDSTPKDWSRIGAFKEIELTKDNFDRYFNGFGADEKEARKLRRQNHTAWQIIDKDEPVSLYLLLQQKDGTLLLCYGYYDEEGETDPYSDDSVFRGMFTLSPMKDYALPDETIVETPLSYQIYTYADSPDPLLPTIMLANEDDSFQFVFSGLSSYLPVGRYRYEGDTLILSSSFDDNCYYFHVDGETFVFDAARSSKIPSYRYSADSYDSLSPVPDGAVFAPVKEEVKTDERLEYDRKLDEAILSAFTYHLPDDPTGLLYAQSYVVIDTETASGTPLLGKDDDLVYKTFYLATMFSSYSTYGGVLTTVTEHLYPAMVTISIENGETFTATDLWFPTEGDGYEDSIRKKFPPEAAEQALNIGQYSEELMNQCVTIALSRLEKVGGVDAAITALLSLIAEPNVDVETAIDEHMGEYEQLLGYGEYTLRYCFTEFFKGDQTDLRADIMVKLCRTIIRDQYPSVKNRDILPGDYDPTYNTAQDWFDLFYQNCKTLEEKEGARGLAECQGAYLLLQIADMTE